MTEDKENKVVVRAILLKKNGKIILGKRAAGRGANQYALIGGKTEGKESLEETIKREVKEELGISFLKPTLWKEENDKKSVPRETWKVYYFYGSFVGKFKINKNEVLDVISIDKENLADIDFAFDHKKILEEFFNKLEFKKTIRSLRSS